MINLEVGKSYITRDGRISGKVGNIPDEFKKLVVSPEEPLFYKIDDNVIFVQPNGHCLWEKVNGAPLETADDLIMEAV